MSMGVCVCVQNYSNFEKTFAIEQKNNNKTFHSFSQSPPSPSTSQSFIQNTGHEFWRMDEKKNKLF